MAQGGEEQKIHFKDSGMYNRALEIQNWKKNTGTGKVWVRSFKNVRGRRNLVKAKQSWRCMEKHKGLWKNDKLVRIKSER